MVKLTINGHFQLQISLPEGKGDKKRQSLKKKKEAKDNCQDAQKNCTFMLGIQTSILAVSCDSDEFLVSKFEASKLSHLHQIISNCVS